MKHCGYMKIGDRQLKFAQHTIFVIPHSFNLEIKIQIGSEFFLKTVTVVSTKTFEPVSKLKMKIVD